MDKPDTCIINIGPNNLLRDQPHEIVAEIVNVANICHTHGVNDVYIASIPIGIGRQEQAATDVNNLLRGKTFYIILHELMTVILHMHIYLEGIFGGYCNNKSNIDNFLKSLEPILDKHISRYENLLLLGDFNSEITEPMEVFCEIYNLKNLIECPTCYKTL